MSPGEKIRNQLLFDLLRKTGSDSPFLRYRHELILLDLTSGKAETLIATQDGRRFDPSFASATQRVAVTFYRKSERDGELRSEILLLSLEGAPPARLFTLASSLYLAERPVFSPDGKHLAAEVYVERSPNPEIFLLQGLDWIVRDWAADMLQGIITNPLSIGVYCPRFLPDNQKVVYLRNDRYEDALEVYLSDLSQKVEPQGEIQKIVGAFYSRRLTYDADVVWRRSAALALDPRSETAFFIRGHYTHPYEQICAVSCDADAKEDPLAATSISEAFKRIGGIYLSPDGRRLAFDGDKVLYMAALDGGELRQLTDHAAGECTCATFSPAGETIACVMNLDDESSSIWRIDPENDADREVLFQAMGGTIHEILWL